MVRQVQFLINIIPILLILSCESQNQKIVLIEMENSNLAGFHNVNGLMFKNEKPYSGYIFSLYPQTNDTLEVTGYYLGREHGNWRKYDINGFKKESRYFVNGSKEGELKAWWPDGKRKLNYHFLNNEYEGNYKEWNYDGQLTLNLNYHKGYEEGVEQMFYDDGKVRANYIIKNGRRFGLLGTKNCTNVSDSIFKN